MMTAALLALTFVALAIVPCIIGIFVRASLQKTATQSPDPLHAQPLTQ